jgi:hypothetical protein
MGNQFRNSKVEEQIESQVEDEVLPEVNEKAEIPRNFFTLMFTEGVISKQAARDDLYR